VPAPQSLWELVQLDPNLSEFAAAVQSAGLVGLLDGTMTVADLSALLGIDLQVELGLDPLLEIYTVFAPPNSVVTALPDWAAIKADPAASRRFVLSHIVPDSYLVAEVFAFTELTSLNGDVLAVDSVAQTISGAHVVTPDLAAPNGVLHVVDAFVIVPTLAPPTTTTVAPTTVPAVDTDLDGLPDADETALGTDPNNPDTDGDGVGDGSEAANGTNPLDPTSF
jgi:uncharacterized surface protein with fasciclin (FAS1) repeats